MEKAMLVYQAGIANVFEVNCFNLSNFGRDAVRIFQGDFYGAQKFASGLAIAGVIVRTAGCNMAGDIACQKWTEDFDSLPFTDDLFIVHCN